MQSCNSTSYTSRMNSPSSLPYIPPHPENFYVQLGTSFTSFNETQNHSSILTPAPQVAEHTLSGLQDAANITNTNNITNLNFNNHNNDGTEDIHNSQFSQHEETQNIQAVNYTQNSEQGNDIEISEPGLLHPRPLRALNIVNAVTENITVPFISSNTSNAVSISTQNTTSQSSTTQSGNNAVPTITVPSLPDPKPLIDHLNTTPEGKKLLKKKELNGAHVRKLCYLIGLSILGPNKREWKQKIIRADVLTLWSSFIPQIWPKEDASTYFTPQRKRLNQLGVKVTDAARGKLFNKLHYMRKRQQDEFEEEDSSEDENDTSLQSTAAERQPSDQIGEDTNLVVDENLYFLLVHDQPNDKIVDCWAATHSRRMREYRDKPIHEYLQTFKALKLPVGIELFKIDFQLLHPQEDYNFLSNWPSISQAIVNTLKARKLREDLNLNDCEHTLAAALLLPFLFDTINIKRKNAKKPSTAIDEPGTSVQGNQEVENVQQDNSTQSSKKQKIVFTRPTRKDAQKRFVLHVETQHCVETALQELSKENRADELPLQPLVMVVGPINAPETYYVVLNDIKYRVSDITSAIDTCFKIFFATNAVYPVHAEREWLFIQRYIYKITTSYDSKPERINLIVKETEKQLQELANNSVQ